MRIIRNFSVISLLTFALIFFGGHTVQAQSTSTDLTIDQLQSQIEQLERQVETLRQELDTQAEELDEEDEEDEEEEAEEDERESATSTGERSALPPQAAPQARIARQLSIGDRGPDVERLQELLATNSEIYPEGLTTGYFGPLTSQAVTRLQQRVGLPTDGEVGSSTLSEINALLNGGAGQSGIIPPGLLKAPGLQNMMGDNDTGTSSDATSTEEEVEGVEDEKEDESATSTDTTTSRNMPDWDSLPIDSELKERLKSSFGGDEGNPGRGQGRGR